MGKDDFPREPQAATTSGFPIRVLIISDVRFVRESLAVVLPREGMLLISGIAADLPEALLGVVDSQPDIVLLDEAFPGGLAAVGRFQDVAREIRVVVIAVAETAEEVITWAEAGVAGYIPRSAGLADTIPLLVDIMRGKQACSGSVAAGLLRRLRNVGTTDGGLCNMTSSPMFTTREAQVAQMIVAGMSNKDIARRLNIGLATAKTHVHHILGKLSLQRRGQAAIWVKTQNYDRFFIFLASLTGPSRSITFLPLASSPR